MPGQGRFSSGRGGQQIGAPLGAFSFSAAITDPVRLTEADGSERQFDQPN